MILYMQGYCACDNADYVFIHDGARPFINEEILKKRAFGCTTDQEPV